MRLAAVLDVPAAPQPGTARRRWSRPLLGISLRPFGAPRWPADIEDPRPIRESEQRRDVLDRETRMRRWLAAADVTAAAAATTFGVAVCGHRALTVWALLILLLVVIAGKSVGIYDRDELLVNNATIDEAPRLFQLATLYALLMVVLQHQLASGRLNTPALLALWAGMFLGLVTARALARQLVQRSTPPERCLFVGTDSAAGRLRAKLAASDGRAVLVGRMSIDGEGPDVAGEAAGVLRRLIDEWHIHRVIVEPSEPHPQTTLDFVREVKETGARVSLLPRILEVVGSSIEVDDLHGLTLLGVRRFGLSRSSALLKRTLDVAGAGCVLVLSAPLLAVLALLLKLDSQGPSIYRQTRIGRDGRPFTMFKLRTMVQGADALKPGLRALNEADGLFKIADDPRITRVGRHLRHYSLDELPQLFNVLRGEMSLVGPRPLVPDDDDQITGLDRRRLDLTPGMTGRWQILGSARVPLAEMIKLDYLYVTGWSLWSDVKILLQTVPYVLGRRGM